MKAQGQQRAFTILEMTVAMGLLAIGLAGIAFIVGRIHRNTSIDRQWIATNHALDAVMEGMVARGYDGLELVADKWMLLPNPIHETAENLDIRATVEQTRPNLKTIVLEANWWSDLTGRLYQAKLKTQVAPRRAKGVRP
jgi:prepilin-type N-terminal cleavage/methylation domain-containing protein